jgi:hypothetical protein
MALVLVLVVVVIQRPWKAGDAAAQARLAKQDALWSAVPAGSRLDRKYAVLADASWVPWGGDTTSVGRWYESSGDGATSTESSWDAAARSSGWAPGGLGSCPGYTKKLGRWSARLTIAPDITKEFLGVRISFERGSATNCT